MASEPMPETRAEPVEVFVSPVGKDAWSGRITEPNAKGTDGPVATLGRARELARRRKGRGDTRRPVRVVMRQGTYVLDQALEFGPADSGVLHCPITYTACPGETVTISGGERITGWREGKVRGKTVWVADVPGGKRKPRLFRQLFVNGRRAARTRLPRKGLYRIESLPDAKAGDKYNTGQTRFVFRKGDIQRWQNPGDVEIMAMTRWIENRLPIKAVDSRRRIVTLERKSMHNLTDDKCDQGTQYWVENVFEALDTPGQWYLDRAKGKLYYMPRRGESIDTAEIVAPRLTELVRLDGSAKRKVEHIVFENLCFAHSEWPIPAGHCAFNQASHSVPAAVTMTHAHRCRVVGCELAHLGGYAVEVADGCMDVDVCANTIADLGGGGVKVEQGSQRTTIADNVIADGGHLFPSAVGVLVRKSGANKILHNHIHDFYYTGISVGWLWGYGDSGGAFGNVIEYNHVHHIGRGMLSDMGGIYTLGASTGTRIRFNVFHDIESRGYGGWGIYLDEGSTDVLVEKNLVYRTKSGGFHQHYGRNNLIQNNIFALGREYQIARSRVEHHRSITFRRNIVYFTQGTFFRSANVEQNCVFERNLYWDASGRALDFWGKTLDQWQAVGMDADTVIADPLFVDPDTGDFRFRPGSPIAAIGFEPFDLSSVGPRVGRG